MLRLDDPRLCFEVRWSFFDGSTMRREGPPSFAQQRVSLDWLADGVNDSPLGRAEVTSDIATVLLQAAVHIDDLKVAHLLKSGNELFADEFADVRARQGTCPEVLGVVSRELFTCEIAGHLDEEDELVLLLCQLCSCRI